MSEKGKKISLIIFLTLLALMISFFSVVAFNLSPKNIDDDNTIVFEIKPGTGKSSIAENLEKSKLIKNAFFLKLYMYLDNSTLYAGTYKLSPSMSALEILDKIKTEDSLENETITLTFIEGKRLSTYVTQISESFGLSEEEIYNKINDTNFLNSLIDKYWFITKDILNEKIYYPLEGYIYPDTYEFKKTSTIEEIIIKTLDNMNTKLSEYTEEIKLLNLTTHELLTLSSIIELEGSNSNDRAGVAGVFNNRLDSNIPLGSDVTTYYATKKDFKEELSYKDLNDCNAYNTSQAGCLTGLPVGPIASPSLESIVASINPTKHDYFYFVADINQKTYFTRTYDEHVQTINQLKKEGKWFEY